MQIRSVGDAFEVSFSRHRIGFSSRIIVAGHGVGRADTKASIVDERVPPEYRVKWIVSNFPARRASIPLISLS
jgi:hypothetical protein